MGASIPTWAAGPATETTSPGFCCTTTSAASQRISAIAAATKPRWRRLLDAADLSISRTRAWHGANYGLTSMERWVEETLSNTRLSTPARWEREHLQEQMATIRV
jgi:hypothetical protein